MDAVRFGPDAANQARHAPPLAEWEIHAEHRAALDATLFAVPAPVRLLDLGSDGFLKALAGD